MNESYIVTGSQLNHFTCVLFSLFTQLVILNSNAQKFSAAFFVNAMDCTPLDLISLSVQNKIMRERQTA